ncbi:MAG: helix-hairpin-helix domain-containing protein [Candidatus Gracilibacteria bacterium]|jgi:nucleotidyltransferase/DNA polymerase involved in DNA repair|nr:helix-hairpin-helix domain-containing protein [Candidatus Gracilibacteria bacterium]
MNNSHKNLETIPGIGKIMSKEFFNIGIKSVQDFKKQDPEDLYNKICAKQGLQVDRCVLYVCRLAVYFAENKIHDPEKLKWWNWKD